MGRLNNVVKRSKRLWRRCVFDYYNSLAGILHLWSLHMEDYEATGESKLINKCHIYRTKNDWRERSNYYYLVLELLGNRRCWNKCGISIISLSRLMRLRIIGMSYLNLFIFLFPSPFLNPQVQLYHLPIWPSHLEVISTYTNRKYPRCPTNWVKNNN